MCFHSKNGLQVKLVASLALTSLFASIATSLAGPLAEGCRTPTPPACAADGVCYPRRLTWGYYKQNWRRWPVAVPTSAPPAAKEVPVPVTPGDLPPEIAPLETPPPEREEQQAPVQVERPQREVRPQPEAGGLEQQGLPQGDQAPMPDATGTTPPPAAAPTKPFSMPLIQPSPPTDSLFDMPSLEEPTVPPVTPIAPPLELDPESPSAVPTPLPNQFNDIDAPPSLPWSLTQDQSTLGPASDERGSDDRSPTPRKNSERQAEFVPPRRETTTPTSEASTLQLAGNTSATQPTATPVVQATPRGRSKSAPRVSRNLRRVRRSLYFAPETAPPPLPDSRR